MCVGYIDSRQNVVFNDDHLNTDLNLKQPKLFKSDLLSVQLTSKVTLLTEIHDAKYDTRMCVNFPCLCCKYARKIENFLTKVHQTVSNVMKNNYL